MSTLRDTEACAPITAAVDGPQPEPTTTYEQALETIDDLLRRKRACAQQLQSHTSAAPATGCDSVEGHDTAMRDAECVPSTSHELQVRTLADEVAALRVQLANSESRADRAVAELSSARARVTILSSALAARTEELKMWKECSQGVQPKCKGVLSSQRAGQPGLSRRRTHDDMHRLIVLQSAAESTERCTATACQAAEGKGPSLFESADIVQTAGSASRRLRQPGASGRLHQRLEASLAA